MIRGDTKSDYELLDELKLESSKYQNLLKENQQLKEQLNFLRKRENKLQAIEQMFKSGRVDLDKLTMIVKEDL